MESYSTRRLSTVPYGDPHTREKSPPVGEGCWFDYRRTWVASSSHQNMILHCILLLRPHLLSTQRTYESGCKWKWEAGSYSINWARKLEVVKWEVWSGIWKKKKIENRKLKLNFLMARTVLVGESVRHWSIFGVQYERQLALRNVGWRILHGPIFIFIPERKRSFFFRLISVDIRYPKFAP